MATREKMNAKQRASKRKGKMVLFTVEIIIILIMLVVLSQLMFPKNDTDGSGSGGFFSSLFGNYNSEGPKMAVLDEEELQIPSEVKVMTEEGGTMHGYMNIALFGVDAETDSQLYKGSRSDSTMVASINMDTGEIKLVSVYRDTYLNLGTDEYAKCNAAYSYGGAEQAIKMLNMNLDMNITNFVTVGYKGLSKVIDGLGGVYIDVDEEELKHINNYQASVAGVLKCEYTMVTEPGYQLLNGVQATAYCRIRYTKGDDFQRAARQREVIKAIEEQAKKTDLVTLTKVFNDSIDDIYTSLDSSDILDLLGNITKYKIVDEDGFPQPDKRGNANMGAKGACIIPTDLESNVVWLHHFLFEDEDYTVTDTVRECSQKISSDASKYMQ